jgi:hypothetical protein
MKWGNTNEIVEALNKQYPGDSFGKREFNI